MAQENNKTIPWKEFIKLELFPQSRPMEITDKGLVDKMLGQLQPEISEFTFTNLYSWRNFYLTRVCRLDDFLIISCGNPEGVNFFPPLGKGDIKAAIKSCLEKFPAAKFLRLPENVAGLFRDEPGLTIEEDRNNFDYIYRRVDLVELKGKKFDAKRNFVKRFFKQYQPVCRHANSDDVEQCLRFHNEWCEDRDCEGNAGLRHEKEAIMQMLLHCHELGVLGAVIEIEGRVKAFSIGEALNNKTFVVHAEKASANFIGIYQAINNYFASIIPENFEFVNREQDLGAENLRKAKMSYQPSGFVKKYILSKKKVK